MLTLYDYFRSSASFRVRIALNLKGLDHQTISVHLLNNGGEQHSEEYRQINPQQLVPTFKDGTHTLTQSLAIIEYLEDMYPTPALLPKQPYEKALVRAFALAIIADIHPLNNLRVLNYLTQHLSIDTEQKKQWYQHWMMKGLTALEAQIPNTSTAFCFGDQPSLADICLVPQLYNARRFECNLADFPNLVRVDANCQQLPAFTKAWPAEAVA